MKKKDFKQKLQLHKKVISNLDASLLQGGTDIPIPVTTIIKTIKTIKTNYRACTIIATCHCSMHCPTTTEVDTNCNTEQC
ncbi:class I lanthipeptide [uncultured Kordia sp.]|uniref:class I lanthipeptide n=1 Tax=uncultured Kordia sp. TaxID=507699 RepID=UPI00260A59B5|nr:class I lanthipeptide [uncultured Kordia sp.]